MVRRTSGLFRGVDLESAASVRAFITAITFLLHFLPRCTAAEKKKMYSERHGPVFSAADWVVLRMGDSPLLNRMISDFLVYTHEGGISDPLLLTNVGWLERLADVHVLAPWFKDTYDKSEAVYDAYLEHGTLPKPHITEQEQTRLDLVEEVKVFNADQRRLAQEEIEAEAEARRKKRKAPKKAKASKRSGKQPRGVVKTPAQSRATPAATRARSTRVKK